MPDVVDDDDDADSEDQPPDNGRVPVSRRSHVIPQLPERVIGANEVSGDSSAEAQDVAAISGAVEPQPQLTGAEMPNSCGTAEVAEQEKEMRKVARSLSQVYFQHTQHVFNAEIQQQQQQQLMVHNSESRVEKLVQRSQVIAGAEQSHRPRPNPRLPGANNVDEFADHKVAKLQSLTDLFTEKRKQKQEDHKYYLALKSDDCAQKGLYPVSLQYQYIGYSYRQFFSLNNSHLF